MRADAPTPHAAPSAPPFNPAPWRRRVAGPFLFILLAAQCAVTFGWFLPALTLRMDLTFPEGAIAARALAVARGAGAYADWRQWPHQFAPYGPLTYYPVGWAARALDVGRDSGRDAMLVYALGRAQSLVAIFAALAALAAIVRLFIAPARRGWLWGVFAVLLVFDWPWQIEYVFSYRPDAPKAAFALWALWVMLARPPRRGAVAAVTLLLWLSFWTKPTAWAMPLAAAWWVARGHGRARGAAWLAGFGCAGLAAFFALDHAMQGLLYLNMVESLRNGASFTVLKIFSGHVLDVSMLLLAGAAVLAALGLARRGAEPREQLLHGAFLATLAAALLQCLKVGADLNYLFDAWLLGCVIWARALARVWDAGAPAESKNLAAPRAKYHAALAVVLILAVADVCLLYDAHYSRFLLYFHGLAIACAGVVAALLLAPGAPRRRAEAGLWGLMALALAVEAPLVAGSLADRVRIIGGIMPPHPPGMLLNLKPDPAALILSNKPSIPLEFGSSATVMDCLQYQLLAADGKIDTAPLRRRVASRAFDYITLEPWYFEPDFQAELSAGRQDEPFFKGFLALLGEHYELAWRYKRWTVWRPKRNP